jgi:ABC-type multidrug transport system fused ATPase/permease subunit
MLFSFFQMPTYFLFVLIFVLIFFCNWLGYRYRKRQMEKFPGKIKDKMSAVEGSILGLLGLLLGFTFSIAVTKFEARRHLIVDEANTLGNTILRADLYPDSVRSVLRTDLQQYLETRIAYYEAGNNKVKINDEIEKGQKISDRIWKKVAFHSHYDEYKVRSMQMIPKLTEMIDIAVERDAARLASVPPLVLWTLLFLLIASSFLLGSDYNGQQRNVILLVGYALVMSVTLNLISELNHPREGLINLNEAEKKMENLRKMFD